MNGRKRRAKWRRKKRTLGALVITAVLLGTIFVFSAAMATAFAVQSRQSSRAFSDLAEAAEMTRQAETVTAALGIISSAPKAETDADMDTEKMEEQEKQLYTGYAALYLENSDFVGWLRVGNTKIDYPVMHTPDEPEYYLYRAFDRSGSESGTLFIGGDCTADSDFFIIYGHNMRDGSMFGTLDYYAKRTFWEENPLFSFTGIREEREYEIFAAIQTRVLYQDEIGYRYYFQTGDLTEEDFSELIAWLQENALYDTGIVPVYGEQIVVLSTCDYHTENGRFLVAAKR